MGGVVWFEDPLVKLKKKKTVTERKENQKPKQQKLSSHEALKSVIQLHLFCLCKT